jgi:hypothetical protein
MASSFCLNDMPRGKQRSHLERSPLRTSPRPKRLGGRRLLFAKTICQGANKEAILGIHAFAHPLATRRLGGQGLFDLAIRRGAATKASRVSVFLRMPSPPKNWGDVTYSIQRYAEGLVQYPLERQRPHVCTPP